MSYRPRHLTRDDQVIFYCRFLDSKGFVAEVFPGVSEKGLKQIDINQCSAVISTYIIHHTVEYNVCAVHKIYIIYLSLYIGYYIIIALMQYFRDISASKAPNPSPPRAPHVDYLARKGRGLAKKATHSRHP